jgi:hypothetical protein
VGSTNRRGARARAARVVPAAWLAVLSACASSDATGHDASPDDATVGCRGGSWRAGPPLLDQRESSAAFLLEDGKVLLVGGHFRYAGETPLDTCEIVDVAAGTSRWTGAFTTSRTTSGIGGTVLLDDRRVWSGSPFVFSGEPPISAEIWDPRTGAWTPTGAQTLGGGPALALPDGRVLVAGGIDWSTDTPTARVEIWDPATGALTSAASMRAPRVGHLLVLAAGRPIAIGGFRTYGGGGEGTTSCEAFDAALGSWSAIASTAVARGNATAVQLADGRLLVTGGTRESGGYREELASAEIYDPDRDEWRAAAPMLEARRAHTLTLLDDGRVLAAGGARDASSRSTTTTEIYDPSTDTWVPSAPMHRARASASAVRLPSGEILVAGGWNDGFYASELFTLCD